MKWYGDCVSEYGNRIYHSMLQTLSPDAAIHKGLCLHTKEYITTMSQDLLLYFSIIVILRANEKLSTKT